MHKNKNALEKSYQALYPFSGQYKVDFKRFLFSLNLLSEHSLIKGKKILDIGSGIGVIVSALQNLGADTTGVDRFIFPNEKQNYYSIQEFDKLNTLWKKENIKIIKSDIVNEKLPFLDKIFDLVICDATIEHLPESPKGLFQEIHRVLKDNGAFLVTTPNLTSLLKRLRFFLLGRSPHWDIKDFFESGSDFKGHRREFTVEEIIKMLEWSSFGIIERKTKNIFFDPKKILKPNKTTEQICCLFSWPFSNMREMIYILAKKQ
ncbi:class I SAM-dependent methyltransferase [Patescibacteria group bacterium]|nr:class I SAM-dependent methyltransferase [Patescibacteria group bacterium]